MATANLSVGINTDKAKTDLQELKTWMAKGLTDMTLSINSTALQTSINTAMKGPSGGYRLHINAAQLKTDVADALKGAVAGAKVGGGSIDSTQIAAGIKQIKQTLSTGLAEAGQEGGKRLTKTITDDFGNLVTVSHKAGVASGKAFSVGVATSDNIGYQVKFAKHLQEQAKAAAASNATRIDPRTLLGLPSRDEMKGIGASLAAQFREGAKVEALRASAASKVDPRTLLGLPSRDEMKGIGASLAAQFREGAKVEALRGASNRSRLDPITLLGIETSGKSAKESASVFLEAEKGIKKVGQAHTEATGKTKAHTAAMNDAHSAARGLASGMGMMWLTWGNIAPLLAGASLSHGFIQAMKAGTEFAYQLTFVKALGGETAESVRGIGAAALELSKQGLFGPVELANGLRTLSQAGLSAAESMKALPVVLDLATVGEMNMKDAAITLVGVMTAFNLEKSDLSKIGDTFAKAAAVSQTSVEQMTQAMKTASVVGEQYGASMGDTATALTILARLNITGTTAGTSLRNMLKELYTPTEKAAKIMKDLGVSAQTAAGEMKPFPDVIFSMKKKLEEFNKASQVKILQGMFGERGAKEAIAMLSMTREEWDKLNKTISESSGFMRDVSAELEGTVKGSFKQAINTLQASLIEAYNSTEGAAGQLAGKLKETFGSAEFKESLTAIVNGMLSITNALVAMAPALAVAAGGWIALRAAMIGAAIWTSVSTALAGATLATQTLGAVAAGAATTMTGSTGILAAARMLPGALGAAGASLIATTGLLGPLAFAIGVAGAAWYLFRDRTDDALNQSTAKVRTSTQEMISDLRKFQAEAGKLNAGTVRGRADAAFSATEGTWESLTKDKKEAAKRFGLSERDLSGDFNEYAVAAKATSKYNIFPVLSAIKQKSAEAAAQREAALGLLKLAKKAEDDDLLIAKSAQVKAGTKNYEVGGGGGGGGGGRADREAAKLENANVLDLEKRYQAELKTADAHYARLAKVENASAQYGIKTRDEAEAEINRLSEEHWSERLEKVSAMSDEMSALLGKSVKLSEADAQKAKTFVATAQEEIKTLKEKIEWIKEEAKLKAQGAQIRFDKDLRGAADELTKEQAARRQKIYGGAEDPISRARAEGELAAELKYTKLRTEAEEELRIARLGGDQAAIDSAERRRDVVLETLAQQKAAMADMFEADTRYMQSAEYGWNQFWTKYRENGLTAAKVVEQGLDSVTSNLEKAFSDMFEKGTFDAKSMMKAISADLGKLVAKMAVADLGRIITGKGDSSGTLLSNIFGAATKGGSSNAAAPGTSPFGPTQGAGAEGLVAQAATGLKNFWNSLTGATTATENAATKTAESIVQTVTKTTTETSATASLAELAASAQMAATSLSMIGSTGGGGGGASGLGGVLSSIFGGSGGGAASAAASTADFIPYTWAKGGAFENSVKKFARGEAFTNKIVNSPTLFKFADGTGMMGEAGPEAIMPLTRDGQGRLGVRYEGRDAPKPRGDMKVTTNNINVNVHSPKGDSAEIRRAGASVARNIGAAMAGSRRYA